MKASAIAMAAALCLMSLGVLIAEQQQDNPQKPTTEAQAQGQLADKVQMPKDGMAVLVPTQGNEVYGIVHMQESDEGLKLKGKIIGLTPGMHGFHIHEFGDLSDRSGKSAGDHFNPTGGKHGPPGSKESHVGDLGNVEANNEGVAMIDLTVKDLKLHFILGRSLVVHEKADDLETQPSGDSGDRLAIGVIGVANPQLSGSFLEQFETTQTSTRADQQQDQQQKLLEQRRQQLERELQQLKVQQQNQQQTEEQKRAIEQKQQELQRLQQQLEQRKQQIEKQKQNLESKQQQLQEKESDIQKEIKIQTSTESKTEKVEPKTEPKANPDQQ